MDNDTLIDQARHLYALLHVEQHVLSIDNKTRFDRLEHLVIHAHCRYQRRLNRCVLCYQYRLNDCFRDFLDERRRFCPAGNHPSRITLETIVMARESKKRLLWNDEVIV